MSRSVLDPIKQLFSPPKPRWACEFTPHHVVVAGVDSSRKRVAGSVAVPLQGETIVGSLSEKNLSNPDAALEAARTALQQAGARGFEITVVVPDDSSRVAFLTVENLSGSTEDRENFVRWKLKKSVPFDVDAAQISYQVLGSQMDGKGGGSDIVVALSPRSIVREYEELLEKLGLHAGYVMPSTLAAMNLQPSAPAEDELFVKLTPDSITTTVFQKGRSRFFRRVGRMPLYDAVYPTLMYYQDKLGGAAFSSATVCGYDKDPRAEIAELQEKLGVPTKRLEPRNVDDIYKPALGAVDLIWANLI